jgi:hypothetical protein
MIMKANKTKTNLAMGLFLTLVIGVIAYILIKVDGILKKIITPIAHKLQMENIFGELTITILAILSIVILIFVLGFISELPSFSRYKEKMEEFFLKIYPPLSYLKVMADEKLHIERVKADWKPVLALIDNRYLPSFVVEENEEWVTLSVLYVPKSDPMEILIVRKDATQLIPMTTAQMLHNNRLYGMGHLSLIPSALKK